MDLKIRTINSTHTAMSEINNTVFSELSTKTQVEQITNNITPNN